jgi:hypothetical protein
MTTNRNIYREAVPSKSGTASAIAQLLTHVWVLSQYGEARGEPHETNIGEAV